MTLKLKNAEQVEILRQILPRQILWAEMSSSGSSFALDEQPKGLLRGLTAEVDISEQD